MKSLVVAPQHSNTIASLGEAFVIEGVAYSPLKMTFMHNCSGDRKVYCESCEWHTTAADLPERSGVVKPDMCPECAKSGEIGFVRSRITHAQESAEPEEQDVSSILGGTRVE